MTFSAATRRAALALLGALLLSGCTDSSQSQMDEERESHFLMGKSRVSAMDYPAAIESFEKALMVNPRSSAAHFELACLYENRELDPAAAIYHYQEYLKLRPNAENTEIVNQHVLALKQDLVKTVSLGPVTERQQKEFERVVQENKRLTDEVEKWRAYAGQLQKMTNQAPPTPAVNRVTQRDLEVDSARSNATINSVRNNARSNTPAASTPRTHTVQAGETPSTIAKKYRIKVEALMSANPRLDARRMRVGQTVNLPPSSL